MSNIIPFNRAARSGPASGPAKVRECAQGSVAALRAGIGELQVILGCLTFTSDTDRALFTAPDYEGQGINALAARFRATESGGERQGYAAMAAAAYVSSQRMHKVAFWLNDAERWRENGHAGENADLAFRLGDENFIIYAEQALLKNARMHPDCTQHIYHALAASQTLVQKARAFQASLGLPQPASQTQAPSP